MQQANNIHYSIPFYKWDLSIHKFWYLQGSWNQSPMDPESCLSFGRVKSYTQIFDVRGVTPLTPTFSRVSCVRIKNKALSEKTEKEMVSNADAEVVFLGPGDQLAVKDKREEARGAPRYVNLVTEYIHHLHWKTHVSTIPVKLDTKNVTLPKMRKQIVFKGLNFSFCSTTELNNWKPIGTGVSEPLP